MKSALKNFIQRRSTVTKIDFVPPGSEPPPVVPQPPSGKSVISKATIAKDDSDCDARAISESAKSLHWMDLASVEMFLKALHPDELRACAAFCQCVAREVPKVKIHDSLKTSGPSGCTDSPEDTMSKAINNVLKNVEAVMRCDLTKAMSDLRVSIQNESAPRILAPPPPLEAPPTISPAASHEQIPTSGSFPPAISRTTSKQSHAVRLAAALKEADDAEWADLNREDDSKQKNDDVIASAEKLLQKPVMDVTASVDTGALIDEAEQLLSGEVSATMDFPDRESLVVTGKPGRQMTARLRMQAIEEDNGQTAHPLLILLTKKNKINLEEIKSVLEKATGSGNSVDLEAPLDAKNNLPSPLFYAVGVRNPELVQLLVDFRADVMRKFPQSKMWNGIKKGNTALEATSSRKGNFKGTVLEKKYEAIEDILTAEMQLQTKSGVDQMALMDEQITQMVMPRSASDPELGKKDVDDDELSRPDSAMSVRSRRSVGDLGQAPNSFAERRKSVRKQKSFVAAAGADDIMAMARQSTLKFGASDDDLNARGRSKDSRGSLHLRSSTPGANPRGSLNQRGSLHLRSSTPGAVLGEKNTFVRIVDHFENSDPSVHYDMSGSKIGEGSFGSVRVGKHKGSDVARAVKTVPKMKIDQANMWQEIEVMRLIEHPNIIRLYSTYEDDKHICLVTELCEGGELFDAIMQTECGFTEKTAANLFKQMLLAVSYLHQRKICHRDLKPENFLLSEKTDIHNAIVKLIDFGTARQYGDLELMTTKICTVHYVAPEILTKNEKPYTEVCDIWSLGVVFFLCLCGEPPFQGDTDVTVMKAIKKGKYKMDSPVWEQVSADAKELLQKMLQLNPEKRLSAKAALKDRWITETGPQSGAVELLGKGILARLRAFRSQNKLKKVALQIIAHNLSDADVDHLKAVFMKIDRDGSGSLQGDEIEEAIMSSGMDPTTAMEMTQTLWEMAKENEEVDYTQFLAATIDKKHYLQEEAVKAAFSCFDVDGSGTISKEELAACLGIGPAKDSDSASRKLAGDLKCVMGDIDEVERILQEVDKDGNGEIDFNEFMEMMSKTH